jgi:hypothetical protein
MRTRRWLWVALFGAWIGLAAPAQAGPFSWLWPFKKPTPVKKAPKALPRPFVRVKPG